jgi:cell cycle checkpoint protein
VLWIDKYAPRREDELAVHARKLAEVKGWLTAFGKPAPPRGSSSLAFQGAAAGKDPRYGHGQGMLILTGPAGCGKSAMLRVLAAELGYQIVSWDDESGDSGAGAESSFGFGNGGHHGGHGFERKMNVFRSFFATATRYSLALSQLAPAAGSLGSSAVVAAPVTLPARLLVLIEELPYIGREEFRAEFLSVLTSALAMSRHPIVLCLTTENESAGGSGVELAIERLFGKELLQHPRVAVIKANPINNTELIKALQRVIKSDNAAATLHLSAFLVCSSTGQLISVVFSCFFLFVCSLLFSEASSWTCPMKP